MRVLGTALSGCLAAGAVAACGSDTGQPPTIQTVSPQGVSKVAPPAPAPEKWPLTGMAGQVVERPALNVKIENSPEARPQTGLNGTDIVWEEIVEGGISRFVAVFHSTLPKQIGPIRSIRPMDAAIAGPTHGLMVFSGGKSHFIKMARDVGLQLLSEDGGNKGFQRVSGRYAPHNVYANPQDFIDQADAKHKASPAGELAFAEAEANSTAVTAGQAVKKIKLTMSGGAHPQWAWSAKAGKWQRSEGETPATVEGGERIVASNIVAIKVDVRTAQGTDPAGNSIPESILVGEGDGFVASGGSFIEVKWSKAKKTAPLTLKTADGAEVLLAPGNTWVELTPKANGSWTTVAASPSASVSGSTSAPASASPAN